MSLADFVPKSLGARRVMAWEKYIPHKPTLKQKEFLSLSCLEALYGGAAGGGKSDALLMDALQDVCTPGYAAIIFRRTTQDLSLPGALIDRSHQWLRGTDAHWDGIKKQWRFPSNARLAFGYLDSDKDRYRYQSAEFQSVGFDELTQFPEGWYRYLLSRLRRLTSMVIPIRARGATNPGGVGHEWVKSRFVDESARENRQFVPAILDDNPHLDREEYRKSLAELDTVTREQLEKGRWVQDASGLLYPEFRPKEHVLQSLPRDATFTTIVGFDFGVVDSNACALVGWRDHDPITYILKAYEFKGLAEECAAEYRSVERSHPPSKVIGDVGGLGKAIAEDMIRRFNVPIEPAQKHDKLGFIRLLNGALKHNKIRVYGPECRDLIHQWSTLPKDKDTGKEIEGFDNHAADAALYAWRESQSFAERDKEQAEPALNTPEYWAKIERTMKEQSDAWVDQQNRNTENEWDYE